jgi:uroporphyrinogen III methyltransferase/synthase
MSGCVVLVGAGPGDPDLLTVRAAREIAQADVLLHDALIDPVLLELAPPGCERIRVGKRAGEARCASQDQIAELMIARAREGKRVVRLKGGDPFVFGRGGEEASALAAAGVPFEVVPGVSSAIAVPAYAGIPVTDRRGSSSVAVITGHRGSQLHDARVDWEGLARSAQTLVILMGTAWLDDIARRAIAGGMAPDTPAAAIAAGTTPQQRVVAAPLAQLAARVRDAGLRPPTVVVIGAVARFREALQWFERRPLFGRRVLVGRALGQRAELALELRRRAAEPVLVPLLEFAPPADPSPLRAALARADWDWIAFTSANAVEAVCAHAPTGFPGRARIACVGPATAAAARRCGWEPAAVPPGRSLPEELAQELERGSELRGARVLFPRAAGAREELVAALLRAGARVEAIEAYRTAVPPEAGEALRQALGEGLDAVTLTSPSMAEHLFSLLDAPARARLARGAVFACIGPTTAKALARYGAQRCVVAAEQTSAALVDALERAYAEEVDDHGVS